MDSLLGYKGLQDKTKVLEGLSLNLSLRPGRGLGH